MALWASTGRVVIGVFHTESAGNDGQLVPGRLAAAAAAAGAAPPGTLALVEIDNRANVARSAIAAAPAAARRERSIWSATLPSGVAVEPTYAYLRRVAAPS